jgi:hypothetical protein
MYYSNNISLISINRKTISNHYIISFKHVYILENGLHGTPQTTFEVCYGMLKLWFMVYDV